MTDQTAGVAICSTRAPLRRVLAAKAVYPIAASVAVLIVWRIVVSEGGPATMLFAGAVNAALAAAVLLFCRRPLVATVLVGSLAAMISVASELKRQSLNMVLHAYDLVFYLKSASTIAFLWQDFRSYALAGLAAIVLVVLVTILAWRLDGTRVRRRHALAMLTGASVVAFTAADLAGERRHTQFEYQGQYLSSFYRSWSETLETLWRGQLIEASSGPSRASLFTLPKHCRTAEKPPHVILIHHESIMPPALFPTLGYDRTLDPFFRSDDGHTYHLRVETYGGASALTEFSVLTGLSTYAFGGMRQFLHSVLAGKVRDTLPQALARCNYRNVLFYPMLRTFVSADKFFAGAGIKEIFDLKDQRATVTNERDRFYYANALDEIGRHVKGSDKPLFAFVQTMAAHWPYHVTYMPEVDVPGGTKGTHPELHEFLRRVAMAKADYQFLTDELARRYPDERFLIVRYGDHQPMATRMLLGYGEDTEAEDVLADRNSVAFLTFFAINAVNFRPAPLTIPPVVDVPYLGTLLQASAGLPLSDSYRERQRLIASCDGRYAGCYDANKILSFHRRLLDSALLDAR